MRLASRMFFTSLLVIAVLAGVGALSLRAVGRLVSVNREVTTQTVPALRLTASVREAMPSLARLETRFLVLQDRRYATLWDEQASRAGEALGRLGGLLRTPAEEARLLAAATAFDEYRLVVGDERALLRQGDRTGALRLAETEGRGAVDRVEASLDGLLEATYGRVQSAQSEARRLEARTWSGVIAALGAAVVLGLAGTGVVAYRMTRSLRRLSAATAAVAAGSFRDPIPVEGKDEIGQLARSFNVMAARLRKSDDTREEFFATVSHELRSPLTSVREAANLLRERVAGPLTPKQARLVDIIGGSSDRLLGLVNRILDVSRLRAGVLPLARVPVELDRLVARAVEELRPQAEEAGIRLELERTGDDFRVRGDHDRLVEVAVNLIGNAVRFTPRGGGVTARVADGGAEVSLEVEDTGVGIPTAALPGIFEAYRQAHRERGGTGLGLAVVRGVVEAHGGRILVESQEGKGSRFTVILPHARVAA
jgi:signal transduction histidine kinase